MKKNLFKIKVTSANEEVSIFTIARWEDNADDLSFLNSLVNNGFGMKVEIEKLLPEPDKPEPDIIDILVYNDRFWVTIDTIQQFCQITWLFGISRPLLAITELRRTYQ